jgi:hypothetical protein
MSGINNYTFQPVKHSKIKLLILLFFGMNIPVLLMCLRTGKWFNVSEFGITYLLTPGIQLDLYGGSGLTGETDYYAGVGISQRF